MPKGVRAKKPELIAINEDEGPVVVKLSIPRELYDEYARIASEQEVTPSDLLLSRLERCAGHSSIRSLYFHTSQLCRLEEILQKKPISTPEQALALINSALAVRVGDFPPIQLSAQQIKRLNMNAYGGRTTEQFIDGLVRKAVMQAVGV